MNRRQAARIRLGIRAARQALNGRGTEPPAFKIQDHLVWAAFKRTFNGKRTRS